jgi:hypothetical protein
MWGTFRLIYTVAAQIEEKIHIEFYYVYIQVLHQLSDYDQKQAALRRAI